MAVYGTIITEDDRNRAMRIMMHLQQLEGDVRDLPKIGGLPFFREPTLLRDARRLIAPLRTMKKDDIASALDLLDKVEDTVMEYTAPSNALFSESAYEAKLLRAHRETYGPDRDRDFFDLIDAAVLMHEEVDGVASMIHSLWEDMRNRR